MVGKGKFSDTQGPEDLQNRTQPRQRPSLVIGRITARQPLSHALDQRRSVEESGTRLGSLSVGVTSSQEQCSTKRRRNA
jgi:hypothetical protein